MCVCVCRPRVLGSNTIYADGDREADKDRIFFLFLFLSGTRFHRVPWPTRSKSPLTRPLFMSSSSLGLFPPPLPGLLFQSTAGASSSRRRPRPLYTSRTVYNRAHTPSAPRTMPEGGGIQRHSEASEESAAVPRSWFRGRSFRTQCILSSRSSTLYITRMCVRVRLAHATVTRTLPRIGLNRTVTIVIIITTIIVAIIMAIITTMYTRVHDVVRVA